MSSVGLQALFKCPGEKSIALSTTEVMKVLDNAESEFILQ